MGASCASDLQFTRHNSSTLSPPDPYLKRVAISRLVGRNSRNDSQIRPLRRPRSVGRARGRSRLTVPFPCRFGENVLFTASYPHLQESDVGRPRSFTAHDLFYDSLVILNLITLN
ncbi:hypothetical protein TNCV_1393491 [Trichonephila clavipes]|nr:hypothetical protein TNCV_1393491 [Trichonephila clavipes]